ncbi:MAG TPA: hypothetical protein DD379_01830 [Cyanobacteria bacterium UBA11162]|nr:hypothetical protein [Cyanobacteria bacterium UBA11162]
MKKPFYAIAVFFILFAVACGMTKGSFTYKSSNREVMFEVQAQDVETVSAILGFLSVLIGAAKEDRPRS